jgi:G patch domain-containing protein 1
MDDEDLQEAEDSRQLQTSEEFTGFGTEHDPLRRTATMDIFRPSNDPIGVKLLKRMGWKEGQGIGPRIKRAANLGDGQEEEHKDHYLFAPDDFQVVIHAKKTDCKGLGYEVELEDGVPRKDKALNHRLRAPVQEEFSDEDDSDPSLFKTKKPAKQVRKAGFGVGILNDNGSDDEDPYSMGPKISYNRVIGGDKKQKIKTKSTPSSANPLLKTKPSFISKRLVNLKGVLRKCHDGRLPPDGFVLSDELDGFGTMSIGEEKYRPQIVPEDWQAALVPEDDKPPKTDYLSVADAAKVSTLTSKSRASLLGETQLPGKSVFDFLTPAARGRLATATGRENLPLARSEQAPDGHTRTESDLHSLVPVLDKDVALQALNRGVSGWMPYAEDEEKRKRYRIYLEIQARSKQGTEEVELPPRAPGMRQEDWTLEMREFARAAHVFQPITGLMASRFTSSSSLPQTGDGGAADEPADMLLSRPKQRPQDPAEQAAQLGMFGPLTRSFANFYPTRLLCKRFGLPPPDHSVSAGSDTTASGNTSTYQQKSDDVPWPRSVASRGLQIEDTKDRNLASQHRPEIHVPKDDASRPDTTVKVNPDTNEALEQERPGLAVFRAIFGDDDDDEGE